MPDMGLMLVHRNTADMPSHGHILSTLSSLEQTFHVRPSYWIMHVQELHPGPTTSSSPDSRE